MGIKTLNSKMSKIDFIETASKVLLSMDVFIADLNRKQLTEKGIDSEGQSLQEYADATKHIKSNKSGISGIIEYTTLYDTGDFNRSILSDIYGTELVLDATDPKTDDLLGKYGENVLGLTSESIGELRKEFYPLYKKEIDAQLA